MRAFLLLVLTALLAPAAALAVDADGDGYDHTVDCDDGDASVHPGAGAGPGSCTGANKWCGGADLDRTGEVDPLDLRYFEAARGCRTQVEW